MRNQARCGGGLNARVGSFDLLGAEIVGNHATLFGGGVYAGTVGWDAALEGGRIISNSAEYGGGVYAAPGNVTLERGQIVGNYANVEVGTMIHAIAPGSTSHDSGDCQEGIIIDQRGAPRIAPCDMGAYEYGEIYLLTVAKDGTGVGTVEPSVGTHIYLSGTEVLFTATVGLNSTFGGWRGHLSGTTNPTSTIMDENKVVTATFTLITHSLEVHKAGDGNGMVSSTPAGIDCGADCTEIFVAGTVVTLTAMADIDATFEGWSGAGCSGAGDCVIVMDVIKQITTTFIPIEYNIYLALVIRN